MDVDPTFVEGLSLLDYYFGLVMQGKASYDKNLTAPDIENAMWVANKMMEARENANS